LLLPCIDFRHFRFNNLDIFVSTLLLFFFLLQF
jgi:hypothetical protein